MPQLTPYHLAFHSGLHVGAGVDNLNTSLTWVPSDTLWTAVLSTWLLMGHDVSEIVPGVDATPPFRLTSAFPFAGDVRFFPMPVDLRSIFTAEMLRTEGAGKTLKRIRWLSETLLRVALTGEPLDSYLFPESEDEKPKDGLALQGGALWLHRQDADKLPEAIRQLENGRPRPLRALRRQTVWKKQTVQRVAVQRINSNPNLFQVERVNFRVGCGLWFGVEGQFTEMDSIVKLLGESGLGGGRANGYGGFSVNKKPALVLPDATDQTDAYLLSRWHPRPDEFDLLREPTSAYRLVSVGGYLHTYQDVAQRRKRVYMVTEGSLLPALPVGDAPNVQPTYNNSQGDTPHPVYRPGFVVGFGWPVRGG